MALYLGKTSSLLAEVSTRRFAVCALSSYGKRIIWNQKESHDARWMGGCDSCTQWTEVAGGCQRHAYVHLVYSYSVQLGAVFFIHLVLFSEKITHKQNRVILKLLPINPVRTNLHFKSKLYRRAYWPSQQTIITILSSASPPCQFLPHLKAFVFAVPSAWIALFLKFLMGLALCHPLSLSQCHLFREPYPKITHTRAGLHLHCFLFQNPFFISSEVLFKQVNNLFLFVVISLSLESKLHKLRSHVSLGTFKFSSPDRYCNQ